MKSRIQNLLQQYLGAIDELEAESAEYREANKGKFDFKVAGSIVLACVLISTLEYFGGSRDYSLWVKPLGWFMDDSAKFLRGIFRTGERAELFRLMYWAGSTFVAYLVIPAIFTKLVLGERLRDYGLGLTGLGKHAWIYVLLYLLVLPAVVTVAFSESFQKTYPFYDNAYKSLFDLLVWELVYAVQFLSLEFFYRGFMIQSVKKRFGYWAIFVSVIPYCMIHFGKPYPETIGAIIAGLVLGTLAVFTRSVWLGVAIHVSVAVTMDVLSLSIQGKISGIFERLY